MQNARIPDGDTRWTCIQNNLPQQLFTLRKQCYWHTKARYGTNIDTLVKRTVQPRKMIGPILTISIAHVSRVTNDDETPVWSATNLVLVQYSVNSRTLSFSNGRRNRILSPLMEVEKQIISDCNKHAPPLVDRDEDVIFLENWNFLGPLLHSFKRNPALLIACVSLRQLLKKETVENMHSKWKLLWPWGLQ